MQDYLYCDEWYNKINACIDVFFSLVGHVIDNLKSLISKIGEILNILVPERMVRKANPIQKFF